MADETLYVFLNQFPIDTVGNGQKTASDPQSERPRFHQNLVFWNVLSVCKSLKDGVTRLSTHTS